MKIKPPAGSYCSAVRTISLPEMKTRRPDKRKPSGLRAASFTDRQSPPQAVSDATVRVHYNIEKRNVQVFRGSFQAGLRRRVTVHTPFGSLRAEVSGGLLHPPFSIVVDIQ